MRLIGFGALSWTVCLASLLTVTAKDEAVFTVTGGNWEELIKGNDFVAAEFYAPWCGHCKKLAPEWEKAAQKLKANDPPVVLAKVDATAEDNKALAQKYGVQGYPTIKLFRNGDLEKAADYNGPREAPGIVDFLSKQVGPATRELASGAAIQAFQGKDAGALGIFASADAPEFKVFSEVAAALRDDLEFGHSFLAVDPKITPEAKTLPSLVLYKSFDDPITVYEGEWDAEDVKAWLQKESIPQLLELSQDPKSAKFLQKVFADPKPKLLGFASKGFKQLDAFKAALKEASKASDALNVLFVETGANAGALNFFGLKDGDTPAFAIHDQAKNAKYLSKGVKPSDTAKFIKDFAAGKLEKAVKSEEPPAKNDGPVTVVVAKTFDELVLGGKNVLIMFHAPWCGHCKKLSPIFDEVGEAFAGEKDVVIAKFDATANDVPSDKFEVKGFPTVFFIKADGSIVPYSGDRTKEDIITFVGTQSGAKAKAEAEDENDENDDEDDEEPEAPADAKSAASGEQSKDEQAEEIEKDEL